MLHGWDAHPLFSPHGYYVLTVKFHSPLSSYLVTYADIVVPVDSSIFIVLCCFAVVLIHIFCFETDSPLGDRICLLPEQYDVYVVPWCL